MASNDARMKKSELIEELQRLRQRLDLAERRSAELQAVIESMPDSVYFGDENGITHCNGVGLKMLGIASVDELNQRRTKIFEAVAMRRPENGERLTREELPFVRALAGETAIENVLATRLETGEAIYARAAAAPVLHNGQIIGAVVVNSDITERVRAEQEVHRHRQLFQRLAEHSPDLISRYDRAGRCIYISGGAEAATGLPPQAFLGKTKRELGFPEPLCQEWDVAMRRVLMHQEPVHFEFSCAGPKGTRHYLSSLIPEFDEAGDVESMLSINHDITTQKVHEQELLREKAASQRHLAQLQAVLRSIDQGLLISDLGGNIRSMNPRGLALHGMHSMTECRLHFVQLRSNYQLFGLDGEPLSLSRWPLSRALNGETFSNVELEVRPLDGQPRWIGSFSGTPVRNREGQMILAIVTFSDITGRKRDEAQLRELNERLEERVAERTIVSEQRATQLRLLASQLTQAEQQERRRLAQLLHDHLQQLLVAAKMQVGILQSDVQDEPMQEALEHICQLINESITASRSLTVELSPPILHDRGLLAALEWLSRFMEDRHGLKVDFDARRASEPTSEEVRVLLFEIVRELLFNVVKHSGVRRAKIRVGVYGDQLQIAVSDEGRGFELTALQDNESLSGGFGLSSTRQRLELVGGYMTLSSAPLQGTRVQLRAPLHAGEDAPRWRQRPPRPMLLGPTPLRQSASGSTTTPGPADPGGDEPARIRVLLADDHEMVRDGLAQILRRTSGIEVVGEASNGLAVVEMARTLHPNVVIMDVNMPGLNGIAATSQISFEQPDVRVIALSMHEEADMAVAMQEAGAAAYLTKGGPAEALIAAVRNVTARRASHAR